MRHSLHLKRSLLALALVVVSSAAQAAPGCASFLSELLASLPENAPGRIKELDLSVDLPTGTLLRRLKTSVEKGGLASAQYVVDMSDTLYFVGEGATAIDFKALGDQAIPVAKLRLADGTERILPLKEVGELRFNNPDRPLYKKILFGEKPENRSGFVFEKRAGFDLSDDESSAMIRQLDDAASGESDGAIRVARQGDGFERARVYKCTEVFNKHTRSDKFVFDKLAIDMAQLTATIAVMSPQRFEGPAAYWGLIERDPERNYDEDLLAADYLSTPAHTLLRTSASLLLVQAGAGLSRSLTTRFGVSLLSTGLQAMLYHSMTDNDSKKIGLYNLGYMVFSVTKAHYFDKWIYNNLPNIAYNACLKNSALKFIVSPTVVRIGEGLGSTVIYFGGRKAFVGE